jgi:hypothetical protein
MTNPERLFPLLVVAVAVACSNADTAQLRRTTTAAYDQHTGRLAQLTADFDGNGTIDTWTYMDGTKVLRTESDLDEDGRIDRWEYITAAGDLDRIALSRQGTGRPDAWEFYEAGQRVRCEEDTNGDGRPDAWLTVVDGGVRTASFDEDHDGVPDRRLTYGDGGILISLETRADGRGGYRDKVMVRRR